MVKFLAYGWSSQRTRPALHDQVVAALAAARLTGWEGLMEEQQAYLDGFWAGADVEVEGDAEVQQAVRFGLFHILQAGARAEKRPIAAKGLTGSGYDGHTFWDTETFVLPVLTYTHAAAAADALTWRWLTLPYALDRAKQLGLAGAAFPWRTLRGEESSAYWPAGTAGFHVNADIADAVIRYLDATADERFEREVGLEVLVHTARLVRSQLPSKALEALASIRDAVEEGYGTLEKTASEIDPTLVRPIQGARHQALAGTQDVEKKLVQHLKRRQETELGQIGRARTAVLPSGKPQERVLTVAPFLARYGPALVDDLRDAIEGWYAGALEGASTPS